MLYKANPLRKFTLLILLLLSANLIHAQQDSLHKPDIAILFNPTLLISAEEGVYAEYRPLDWLNITLGGEYNYDAGGNYATQYHTGGRGHTIRSGIFFATGPHDKNFLGLAGFFRQWSINTANIGNEFTDNRVDFELFRDFGGYEGHVYIYTAKLNIWCFDLEDIVTLKEGKNFILQLYLGMGSRHKTIGLTYIGYYGDMNSKTFIPDTHTSSTLAPVNDFDIKLGILIGCRF